MNHSFDSIVITKTILPINYVITNAALGWAYYRVFRLQ
jgi:hypothetical protein